METLHLTLTTHWFNEILSGRKKVEYREDTPYWDKRLFKAFCLKKAKTITFRLGYSKKASRIVVEWLGWEKAFSNELPDGWVARGEFVNKLILGQIIETQI